LDDTGERRGSRGEVRNIAIPPHPRFLAALGTGGRARTGARW